MALAWARGTPSILRMSLAPLGGFRPHIMVVPRVRPGVFVDFLQFCRVACRRELDGSAGKLDHERLADVDKSGILQVRQLMKGGEQIAVEA